MDTGTDPGDVATRPDGELPSTSAAAASPQEPGAEEVKLPRSGMGAVEPRVGERGP